MFNQKNYLYKYKRLRERIYVSKRVYERRKKKRKDDYLRDCPFCKQLNSMKLIGNVWVCLWPDCKNKLSRSL